MAPFSSRFSVRNPETLRQVLFLAWAGLVFFHYFYPVNWSGYSAALSDFFDLRRASAAKFWPNTAVSGQALLCSLGILITLWSWGRRLFSSFGPAVENLPLRLCLQMATGILFFNGLWLGSGLNGLWREPLLWGLGPLFFGVSLWDLARTLRTAAPKAIRPLVRNPAVPGPVPWLASVGLAFLLLSLLAALSPAVYYDGLVYHLSTLEFWRGRHGLADLPTNLYSNYPFGAELYFMNGFFFQGTETARMLNALASGLCALAAAGWAAEKGGAFLGCLTWTTVLALPLVSSAVRNSQNDVFLAFFFILFLYALEQWGSQKGPSRWPLWAGLLGGALLTVKYSAVAGLAAALPALWMFRRGHRGIRKREMALAAGVAALCALPWLLKNWVYRAGPFYPYFILGSGGEALPPEKIQALLNDHERGWAPGFSPLQWFLRVAGQDLDRTIAPLLFTFLPFLFLKAEWGPSTRRLAVVSGLYLLLGFLISHQTRLMVPCFVLCLTTAAMVLADAGKGPWRGVWTACVLVFAGLSLLSLLRLDVDYYQADRVPLGKATRAEYLAACPQTASYYGLTQAASALLPASDRLLIVGDARSLYYSQDRYANSVFDDQILARLARRQKDADGIRKALREMGMDDLVVAGEEGRRLAAEYDYYPLSPAEWAKLDGFLQRWTDPVYLRGYNGIYRLRGKRALRAAPIPDLLELMRGKS